MKWNHEVDVVCTGAGVGGLATAIVAADDGLDVLVARSSGAGSAGADSMADRTHPWLIDVVDPETNDYFAALSADLGPLSWTGCDDGIPVRVVHPTAPLESRRTVEPFSGARLKDWTASCLRSPYGFLSTRISGRCPTTKMRTPGGETVDVAVVGSVDTRAYGPVGTGLGDWLLAQAHERSIDMTDAAGLQRIVFEEGEAVGVVLGTQDGSYAVRARRGLMVAPARGPWNTAGTTSALGEHGSVRVCLVMQSASRFGRVELLTTAPAPAAAPLRPACKAVNRSLRDSLRETKQNHAQRRCRKMHRYPPFGQ